MTTNEIDKKIIEAGQKILELEDEIERLQYLKSQDPAEVQRRKEEWDAMPEYKKSLYNMMISNLIKPSPLLNALSSNELVNVEYQK